MNEKKILQESRIIIPAGGSGARFGENKLLVKIDGVELFIYTLKPFLQLFASEQIYIVVPQQELSLFKELTLQYFPHNKLNFINGGEARAESVYNGVEVISQKKSENNIKYIIIHDAARPLITTDIIKHSVNHLAEEEKNIDGIVVAKKVVDTIKRVGNDGCFAETICREDLWAMETPQVFLWDKFKKAYSNVIEKNCNLASFTDDAVIMAQSEFIIKPLENNEINSKITYRNDLKIASLLLEKLYGE